MDFLAWIFYGLARRESEFRFSADSALFWHFFGKVFIKNRHFFLYFFEKIIRISAKLSGCIGIKSEYLANVFQKFDKNRKRPEKLTNYKFLIKFRRRKSDKSLPKTMQISAKKVPKSGEIGFRIDV